MQILQISTDIYTIHKYYIFLYAYFAVKHSSMFVFLCVSIPCNLRSIVLIYIVIFKMWTKSRTLSCHEHDHSTRTTIELSLQEEEAEEEAEQPNGWD